MIGKFTIVGIGRRRVETQAILFHNNRLGVSCKIFLVDESLLRCNEKVLFASFANLWSLHNRHVSIDLITIKFFVESRTSASCLVILIVLTTSEMLWGCFVIIDGIALILLFRHFFECEELSLFDRFGRICRIGFCILILSVFGG